MNTTINDSFMNPDRFGFTTIPFKLDGNKEPRPDVPKWRIARSNARSMGVRMYKHTKPCKICKSNQRRVYDNSCYSCWKETKKPHK